MAARLMQRAVFGGIGRQLVQRHRQHLHRAGSQAHARRPVQRHPLRASLAQHAHRAQIGADQRVERHPVMLVQPGEQALHPRQRTQPVAEPLAEIGEVGRAAHRLFRGGADHRDQVAGAVLQLGDQHLLARMHRAQIVDVGGGAEPFDDRARLVPHRRGARLEPAILAVALPPDAIFHLEPALQQRLAPCRACRGPVLRMDGVQPAPVAIGIRALAAIRGPSRAGPGPFAPVHRAPHQLRDTLDQRLQAQLRLPRLGEVVADPADQHHRAAVVQDREIGIAQPADRAVAGPADAIFERHRHAAPDALDRVDGAGPVRREDQVQPAAIIVPRHRRLARLAVDRLERRRQVAPLQPLRLADPQYVARGVAELAELFLAGAPRLFGTLALRDVAEQHRDPVFLPLERKDVEVEGPAQRHLGLLDTQRRAGVQHLSVKLRPARIGVAEQLGGGPADRIGHRSVAHERRIDLDEAEVRPRALGVLQHLDHGIGLVHRLEQRAVTLLALAPGRIDPGALDRPVDALADLADHALLGGCPRARMVVLHRQDADAPVVAEQREVDERRDLPRAQLVAGGRVQPWVGRDIADAHQRARPIFAHEGVVERRHAVFADDRGHAAGMVARHRQPVVADIAVKHPRHTQPLAQPGRGQLRDLGSVGQRAQRVGQVQQEALPLFALAQRLRAFLHRAFQLRPAERGGGQRMVHPVRGGGEPAQPLEDAHILAVEHARRVVRDDPQRADRPLARMKGNEQHLMDQRLCPRRRKEAFGMFEQQHRVTLDYHAARAGIEGHGATAKLAPLAGQRHPAEAPGIAILDQADARRIRHAQIDQRFAQLLQQVAGSFGQFLDQGGKGRRLHGVVRRTRAPVRQIIRDDDVIDAQRGRFACHHNSLTQVTVL